MPLALQIPAEVYTAKANGGKTSKQNRIESKQKGIKHDDKSKTKYK